MIDRLTFTRGGLPVRLRWIVLGWIGAELLVFMLLVHALGLGGTILLGLATTVLGVMTLRRLGTGTLGGLREAMEGREPRQDAVLDGILQGLGAVLLIVPGFLANAVGLALAAPSVRGRAASLFGAEGRLVPGRRSPARTDVIDLGPGDWRTLDRP